MKNYKIMFYFEHLEDERELTDEEFIEVNEQVWKDIEQILKNHEIDTEKKVEYMMMDNTSAYSVDWSKGKAYSSELKLKVEEDFNMEKLVEDLKEKFNIEVEDEENEENEEV